MSMLRQHKTTLLAIPMLFALTMLGILVNLSACGPDTCFSAGTLIDTPDGPIAIEALEIGDVVWSYDLDAARRVPARVTWTFQAEHRPLNRLSFGDGEELLVTSEHPFYVDGDWVEAGELRPGVELFHHDAGELRAVPLVEMAPSVARDTVYNIEVEGHHNFFAGGILVHNKSIAERPCPGPATVNSQGQCECPNAVTELTAESADVVVAADGSGNFTSIQAALDASGECVNIFVKNGTYTEGSTAFFDEDNAATYGGALVINRSITLIGESVAGVVVNSAVSDDLNRIAAVTLDHFEPVDVLVKNMTINHTHPGAASNETTGHFGYSAVAQNSGTSPSNGEVRFERVVFRLPEDSSKGLLYANWPQVVMSFEHITVDYGMTPGYFVHDNGLNPDSSLTNSVFFNVTGQSNDRESLVDGSRIPVSFSLTFGADVDGEGNLNLDPLFTDYDEGDLTLSPESPARGAGQSVNGAPVDMGAF